jgi:DNA-directed RNA polymerase specialized sigma24 family protein
MIIERPLHQAMLDAIPHLRAFAISLTGNVTYADDLVQAALLRGLEKVLSTWRKVGAAGADIPITPAQVSLPR